ncbi:hypothetical protein MIND_01116200 [Mycena indigotica]|uniref:Uncharacterized protein n=1 Tax=Mycena indigotica TaxID=2126181 RepID=A0A8H6S6Q4_9AGAR|nr:uncharacterized protein MIND_01116200 [Mycena indigotica]KAF7293392.1 hypothetical protein MIND_01116200 [Mycena indigotica]
MALQMEKHAPTFWMALSKLLSPSDEQLHLQARKRTEYRKREGKSVVDTAAMELDGIAEGEDEATEVETREDVLERQRVARVRMKQVVCVSIIMNNRNLHCNTLQTLVGVFLHACNAPESVLNFASHIGVSNSPSTNDTTITSLSEDSTTVVRESTTKGESGFSYDNVDINLKHSFSSVEHPTVSLIHMTSRMSFPLQHLKPGDLDCASELWRRSDLNPHRKPEDKY